MAAECNSAKQRSSVPYKFLEDILDSLSFRHPDRPARLWRIECAHGGLRRPKTALKGLHGSPAHRRVLARHSHAAAHELPRARRPAVLLPRVQHHEPRQARRRLSRGHGRSAYIHTFTRALPIPILREAILLAPPAVKTITPARGAPATSSSSSHSPRSSARVQWLLEGAAHRPEPKLAERLAREMIGIL
ncbi:hypothetical protein C8J57DRAFT_1508161 [Mycena rebaudengoi]|nr:hypothetical protein C8J57DRAFT_1508161 [Mycena rebaudengoi]